MRDWLTNDLYWKGFAVFMAIGIWLTVHKFSEEGAPPGLLSVQNTFTNVVMAVSSTADVRGANIVPDEVKVEIDGPPEIMATLNADRIHAFVNLTGIDSAHASSRFVEVAAPLHVTILNIDPPDVNVTIAK
ncbi:MAG: CdaR family protein [Limisphaerales bacterium]